MPIFVEEYRDVVENKSDWGPGPWQEEPDKVVWVDEATDLDCMIVRNRFGSLCGYVGVSKDHPWHSHITDDEDVDIDVSVHGGLTFASGCAEESDPSRFICHIPQPGRPGDIWWFGFDCAHAWDLIPQMEHTYKKIHQKAIDEDDEKTALIFAPESIISGRMYRSIDYVIGEVESLARQLADVK